MSFTFYNKFVENYKLFPCKTAYYQKDKKNSKIFLEKFTFYGLDIELEPEPEPELFKSRNRNRNHNFFKSRNRNHNFSKVGTGIGTVKNSYGSTTQLKGILGDK
jgi:hypothetical protein